MSLPKFSQPWLGLLVTALSQILLGYFTLFIQAVYPVWAAPFWPASGAALAAVLLGGPRMLLGVYLGLVVLGFKFFWGPYPLGIAFLVPFGNLAETTLAFLLLRRLVPRLNPSFTDIRQLAAFILLAPWIPALLSATSIMLFLQTLGSVPADRLLSEIAVYSLGNATGILLLTPLVLVWRDFRTFPWKSPAGRRILALIGGVTLGILAASSSQTPWLRLLAVAAVPFAVWGIWATGIRGATLVCLLAAVSHFALDIPGSRPLSTLLEEKQRLAELRFAAEKQISGTPNPEPPPRLVREVTDQVGLLLILCITLLPLGVAADELRARAERDRLAMAALSSSFWDWTPETGSRIENPALASLLPAGTPLFQPNRPTGSLRLRPTGPDSPIYLSHWVVRESDPSGHPRRVTGILQNLAIEEERDAAIAQARLAELEIQILRSHLNPHLLFNCLTGLRALIAENPAQAREFAGSLARFLRAVVDAEKEKTIPLRTELEICADFLRLEELRGRPTSLRVHLTPGDQQLPIPPLTLVTLLENAAKHGQRNGGPLPVEITADRPDPRHFRLRVRQPGSLQPARDGAHHAGLDLLRRHLAILLGERSRLDLSADGPEAVVAQLVLPV